MVSITFTVFITFMGDTVATHANHSIKARLLIYFKNFKYKRMLEGPYDKETIKHNFVHKSLKCYA